MSCIYICCIYFCDASFPCPISNFDSNQLVVGGGWRVRGWWAGGGGRGGGWYHHQEIPSVKTVSITIIHLSYLSLFITYFCSICLISLTFFLSLFIFQLSPTLYLKYDEKCNLPSASFFTISRVFIEDLEPSPE